jgi:hypothetical protein
MTAKGYQYAITQCDVPLGRRATLEAFRAKRETWLEWLDNDEHHAIWTTISAMIWTDVSFRTLTKLTVDDENSSLGNSLVAEALINGHVATQVLAIRRLMDNGSDVMSLRRLIKDVRRHFDLFTRENYVCHDGLPYDFEDVQMKVSLMPTAQFDQFENLDKPVMPADGMEKAQQVWEALSDEREQYLESVKADLIRAAMPQTATP